METKAVYMFDRDELEAHDKKLIEETAVRTVKAMKDYIFKEPTPEWVSINWIVNNRYCGISSKSAYQRWRTKILRDDPEGKIIRKLPKHRPEINARRFKQWIDQYKADQNKDVRQRMGVI